MPSASAGLMPASRLSPIISIALAWACGRPQTAHVQIRTLGFGGGVVRKLPLIAFGVRAERSLCQARVRISDGTPHRTLQEKIP